MDDTYLTPQQIADKLLIREATVKQYLREGRLQGMKFGKYWRVPLKAFEKFVATSMVEN